MLLFKACLALAGIALIAVGAQHLRYSLLDRNASATVIGIQRQPSDRWEDMSYLVGYQFMTDQRQPAGGTYLLERPARLGDMPRMGSQLTVSYSSYNPDVNQPWSRQNLDMDEVFSGEILSIVGLILLLGGIFLR